jgi:hypothetical protein
MCVLVTAGCGDSSSPTATQTVTIGHAEELTKTEWIAKADAICTEANEEANPIQDEANAMSEAPETAGTLQKLGEILKSGIPSIANETAALRELEPPAEDKEIVQKMIGTVEANVTLGNSMADALESDDLERFEALNEQAEENTTKSQGYGLKVCGADD